MEIIENMEKPMGDDCIKQYLPDAKILTDKDLLKYKNIDNIFDKNKLRDYVIILHLDAPNKGHWTALLKYGDIIEFFDSYGNSPKEVYNFVPNSVKHGLGIKRDALSDMLEKSNYNVIYNPIKYQAENKKEMDINTCGRHCCYRVLQLMGNGKTLPEYYDYMSKIKKIQKIPYDIIVSNLIEK